MMGTLSYERKNVAFYRYMLLGGDPIWEKRVLRGMLLRVQMRPHLEREHIHVFSPCSCSVRLGSIYVFVCWKEHGIMKKGFLSSSSVLG